MTVILVAVITVVLSGICLESYKRHRDLQGVASAIAGEIHSILNMVEKRQTTQQFASLLSHLNAGEAVKFPNITGSDDPSRLDPVLDKYLDRVGLLTNNNLPERVATFYGYLRGIRIDLVNLSKGEFDLPEAQEAIIRADLILWAEAAQLGRSLWLDLRNTAQTRWWLHSRYLQVVAASSATLSAWIATATRTINRFRGRPAPSPLPLSSSPPQPTASVPPQLDRALAASFAPPFQELISEIDKIAESGLAAFMTANNYNTRDEALKHLTVDYMAALHLERASRFLFGSQIDALLYLTSNVGQATKNELTQFYVAASKKFPEIYTRYSFDQWLGFLANWRLVIVDNDVVALTPAGKALVPYANIRGYLATQPQG